MKKNKILYYNVILFLFILGFTSHRFYAQNLDLEAKLPLDKSIVKGVLSNGMTYYIKNTDVTKNVASYYIIQNVGSVLENDDQQGLAHFLEHMAFNGTQNFKGKAILKTMEKHGLVFGRDINAYTSFDETVYNIDNIPTTPELIDTGLAILKDWSNYLTLADTEIDAERGVIKEEWRTGQNGSMRVLEKNIGTMFNHTAYSKRLPIGLMDVVDNFKYKALRDFYHDWYRTDLQAIAIVGDIDVKEVEQKIKTIFSTIPAVKNPKERFTVDIPDNEELLYSIAMDKEVATASISFGIRHTKPEKRETVADLKELTINKMVIRMLSTRMWEASLKPECPFLGAYINYSDHSKSTNALSLDVSPKENLQYEAFKAALTEVNKAVQFGFTQGEIDRTILDMKNEYENKISKIDDRSHGRIISLIQNDYLSHTVLSDIEKEYELQKLIFKTITPDVLHKAIKNLYTEKNRFLTVTGVKGNKNLSKEDALQILKAVENDSTLVAYEDSFTGKTLISGLDIQKGKIVSEKEDKNLEATTFTLSNGIKVHYKFADKNANEVQLQALSYGGLSYLKESDLPSAEILPYVTGYSGLGNYSATDLPKILTGTTAESSIAMTDISETVTGSSATKDTEIMMQLVYLRFVQPRFDKDAYNNVMQNVDNYIVRRKEQVAEKIKDSITYALYGSNNPKKRIFDHAYKEDMSFEKIKAIYADRFKNPADFEFFIVGDIKKEVLKPLLEKYIASIPSTKVKEDWKKDYTPWISNKIDRDIYLKMEDPKSSVNISYENDYTYSLKNEQLARIIGSLLDLRFTETLREEEGGTYGAYVRGVISKRPKEEVTVFVNFDCNPDKVEALIAIVHKEIQKLATGTISKEDLDKTLTSYLKERKQEKDYNRYDLKLLTNYYREGYDMNDLENFETIIKNIKASDVQNFAKTFLKDAKSFEIVFKPKV